MSYPVSEQILLFLPPLSVGARKEIAPLYSYVSHKVAVLGFLVSVSSEVGLGMSPKPVSSLEKE